MIAHQSQFPSARPPRHRLAAFAILVNATDGHVLLVRRRRGGRHWTLPGGKSRREESLSQALVREVREETGLAVEPLRLVAALERSGAAKTLFYFACRILSASPLRRGPCDEIMADGWFSPTALPTPLSPALRLLDTHCLGWWTPAPARFLPLPPHAPVAPPRPLLKLTPQPHHSPEKHRTAPSS